MKFKGLERQENSEITQRYYLPEAATILREGRINERDCDDKNLEAYRRVSAELEYRFQKCGCFLIDSDIQEQSKETLWHWDPDV